MTRIFISYRRRDAQAVAAHLHRRLTDHLPHATLFIDVASLVPADDWRVRLAKAVRAADWCLVLIGRNWLERNEDGTSRLDQRSDVVRHEVSTALTAGVATLPILVDGARMPSADLLPLDIAALTRIQRETLSTATIDADVRRICTLLEDGRPAALREPFPPELVGFWENTTSTSGSSYEFFADGTYLHSMMLVQQRPTGPYTFESFEEGLVDVQPGVLHLRPVRATATQKEASRPETEYTDRRIEIVDKTLHWRLVPSRPTQLLLRRPGETETAYDPV